MTPHTPKELRRNERTSARSFLGQMLMVACVILFAMVVSADDESELPQRDEEPITSSDRDHWSFRPLVRPAVPPTEKTGWARNDIDRFILAKLEAKKLSPVPFASRETLIRRVTFDLTGLPPTPADVTEFLAAEEEDAAYLKLVERLLASPAYGERWAQHWLDLARFAETDGFEHDLVRHHAWRYRDWVINALNADMPYDQFVRLQLAGDLLSKKNRSLAIPTGFLLCGPDMPDINLQDERRHTVLNELTSAVSSVFLGLQMGCAQCHDHKYDPVSQADFYRLRAYFDSLELFREQPVPTPEEVVEYQAKLTEFTTDHREAEERASQLDDQARQRFRDENPDAKPTAAELLDALPPALRKERERLAKELEKKPPAVPLGRAVATAKPVTSYLMIRGDFRRPGPQVAASVPRIVDWRDAETSEKNTRLQLADWLTDPQNPIFTRVIANRLWQYHFGIGLVPTSSDFGLMGDEPTHPELLDWLATEMTRLEFSLKQMHRLIVTSSTYRLASRRENEDDVVWEQNLNRDRENELWGRRTRTRLEGEAIRDAMLAAAGTLNDRRGGPGIQAPLPRELVDTLLKNQWNVSPDPVDHHRRSIYLFVRRNLRYPLFEAFDRPDTNASCPRRNQSTIAPQALFLLNSEFSLATARDLAGQVFSKAGADVAQQVEVCYQRTLSRTPTEEERTVGVEFLAKLTNQWSKARTPQDSLPLPTNIATDADPHAGAALTAYCLALFNLNEFLYVD